MVTNISNQIPLHKQIARAASYSIYSQDTVSDENMRKHNPFKRVSIELTKTPARIAGYGGLVIAGITTIRNLVNGSNVTDDSFFGMVKRWVLTGLGLVLSLASLVFGNIGSDETRQKQQVLKSVLDKIKSNVRDKVQMHDSLKSMQRAFNNNRTNKLLHNFDGKQCREKILKNSGLKYFTSNGFEYLQTLPELCKEFRVNGESRIYGLRFFISKGKDVNETYAKRSTLQLVSKVRGESGNDKNFVIEQCSEKISLLDLLGLELGIEEEIEREESKGEKDKGKDKTNEEGTGPPPSTIRGPWL